MKCQGKYAGFASSHIIKKPVVDESINEQKVTEGDYMHPIINLNPAKKVNDADVGLVSGELETTTDSDISVCAIMWEV